MSEDVVYEGKLCTIKRQGEGFWVETDTWAQYEPDELLSELQLIIAAVMGAKA